MEKTEAPKGSVFNIILGLILGGAISYFYLYAMIYLLKG